MPKDALEDPTGVDSVADRSDSAAEPLGTGWMVTGSTAAGALGPGAVSRCEIWSQPLVMAAVAKKMSAKEGERLGYILIV